MPLSNLNAEQYAAATAPFGSNLIIASAGTGKTSTIVARIAHLLALGTAPERILLLTFTNKAAAEMLSRLAKKFDKKIIEKINAGTFHATAYALLRANGAKITLKQPSELKLLLKSIASERKFHHISDIGAYSGAYLYELYSLYQNSCVDDEEFSTWFSAKNSEQSVFADIYADILAQFEKEKQNFGYADFNDLLIFLRTALKKGEIKSEFDEILVDEYQDTNLLQSSLIDAFKAPSLFCVGDFDQSIYAFNGANIEIIGSFKDRYKNASIYTLNTNYRSSEKILKLANKVISFNPRLYEKELKVGRNDVSVAPKLLVYDDLFMQYQGIAQIISQKSVQKDEIAVIFRNNSSADGVEIALKELGIASRRKGSGSFFESREIKALISLLSLLLNGRDIMAFIDIAQYFKGIGEAKAKRLFEMLLELGEGDAIKGLNEPKENAKITPKRRRNYEMGLFDEEFENTSQISSAPKTLQNHQIASFANLEELNFLADLKEYILALKGVNDTNAVLKSTINSAIYNKIANVLAHKKAIRKDKSVDENEQKSAFERILLRAKSLENMTKNYKDLRTFYNFLSLSDSQMSADAGVNLLSVHASKGLEFELVFVIDLAQGRFPNIRLSATAGGIEEERRLFYVAVTRAKNELYLSYAKYDKNGRASYEPSQFLKEAGFKIE